MAASGVKPIKFRELGYFTRNGVIYKSSPKEMKQVAQYTDIGDVIEKSDISDFEDSFIPEPNSGCWLWLKKYWGRYGLFYFRHYNTALNASRASWLIYRGAIPKGMHVLHQCDTPACVNPDHLFLGTHADNMKDMSQKGRAGSQKP